MENAANLVSSLRVLAGAPCLRISSMIAAHADAEACVCDLTEPPRIGRPTASRHLNTLVEAGYLTRSKRRTWAYYGLAPGALDYAAGPLATV